MNCVIPGANLKVFGRAVQALSKVGDELYLEAFKERLSLKTINLSKTSYCTFNFNDVFFSTYEVDELDTQSSQGITLRLQIKSVLHVFKSPHIKERNVEQCRIQHTKDSDEVTFKLKYKNEASTTHQFVLTEGDFLRIAYSSEASPNKISAPGRFFTQILTNFQLSDDDISLETCALKVVFRNHCFENANSVRGIRSQIVLAAHEFNLFNVGQTGNVSYSLKPFRTAVQFADTFNLNISINFNTGNKPAILVVQTPTFEANFVMSTNDPDSATQSTVATVREPPKKKAKTASITDQDQKALEDKIWDSEFDLAVDKGEAPVSNLNAENGVENADAATEAPDSPKTKRLRIVFSKLFKDSVLSPVGSILARCSDVDSD